MADDDWYATALGKLLANLQSLEFVIRNALYDQFARPDNALRGSLDSLAIGDEVPVNPFTDYSSLPELIHRYNDSRSSGEQRVDPTVIELRDALAHGRISGPVGSAHFSVVKFEKPKDGTTRVAFVAELTPEWLRQQRRRVAAEIQKVLRTRKNLPRI
jgi:hypothetical protein